MKNEWKIGENTSLKRLRVKFKMANQREMFSILYDKHSNFLKLIFHLKKKVHVNFNILNVLRNLITFNKI